MGLEYVDIFYSHRPDPYTPLEETMGALAQIVRQGKALYIGLSNYSAEITEQAVRILKEMGVSCLIHQPKYSMFERWVEGGLLEVLEKNGIGCIAFSPLAQGLLTNRYLKGIPEGSRASKGEFLKAEHITDEKLSKIKSLNEIAISRGQSLAQMALSWLLRDDRITSVLIGASSTNQLEDNLKAMDNTVFSTGELAAIENVLRE
jgi:L-glyceraldehyde 3-phosphate reductase